MSDREGGCMKLEELRGLLYEIRDLSKGSISYAISCIDSSTDSAYFISLLSVFERNAGIILKLFDQLECLPDAERLFREKIPV